MMSGLLSQTITLFLPLFSPSFGEILWLQQLAYIQTFPNIIFNFVLFLL